MLDLKEKFLEVFGVKYEREFFSPGRVNLIGEHTDYNGGNVFPCAIDRGTYGLVKLRDDKKFRMYSENFEKNALVVNKRYSCLWNGFCGFYICKKRLLCCKSIY